MIGQKEFIQLYDKLTKQGIVITSKNKTNRWLWKAIHYFLLIITFGKMDGFYYNFTTTFNDTIAFYAGWDRETAGLRSYVTLRHEEVHIEQDKRYGSFKMTFLYLFHSESRYRMEREAYLESMIAMDEFDLEPRLTWYVDTLSGPSYFWACRDKEQIRKWFEKELDDRGIKYQQ